MAQSVKHGLRKSWWLGQPGTMRKDKDCPVQAGSTGNNCRFNARVPGGKSRDRPFFRAGISFALLPQSETVP